MESPQELNPAQSEVLELLGASKTERPQFDSVLKHELRTALDNGLAEAARQVGENDQVWVSKHLLGQVLGCERKYVAEDAIPFEWTVPIARGSVAHKAIELSIHQKGKPTPLELIDHALASLSEGTDGLADYLQTCGEVATAELRAEANDRVTKFMESFPPLDTRWWPVTESRLRLEVHDRFVFSGKVDLSLGKAQGDIAGKVLIDLKTGGWSPLHREDLRFYALLEAIRVGTPPRLLATYYLDSGTIHPEEVTEGVLQAAVKRIIAGVERIIALRAGDREPATAPGPLCRFCPVLEDCDAGQRHLEDDSY